MEVTMTNHLERAKRYLAIAESENSKREAYKLAAEAITEHKAQTGDTNRAIAAELQLSTTRYGGEKYVAQLLKWREDGYVAETPWLNDPNATTRAAKSHAKKVLRDPGTRREVLEGLTPAERAEVATEALSGAEAQKAMHTTPEGRRTVLGTVAEAPEEHTFRRQRQRRENSEYHWFPATLVTRALFSMYSAWAKVKDPGYPLPEQENQREHTLVMLDKIDRYSASMRRLLEGGQNLDEGLADLLSDEERREAQENEES